MSRTIYRNALTGLVLGLLVFLPRGVEVLYALDKKQDTATKSRSPQAHAPAWVKRLGGLRIWRISFVPSYRQEVVFDDNIFLNNHGEGRGRQADLIITERPGVRVAFAYRQANVSLDYRGELRQYVHHPELNTRGFAGDVKLELNLGLEQQLIKIQRQRGRFFFRANNDISGRTDAVDLVSPELVARLRNQFTMRAGLEFRGGEFYLQYNNKYVYVFEQEFKRIQHLQQSLTLGAKSQVTPRWTVELQLTPGLIEFDKSVLSDQQFIQVIGQARGTLSKNLSTTLRAGFRHQRVSRVGSNQDKSEFSGVVFNAALRWDLNQRTRLFLSAIRELQVSSVSNFKDATIAQVRLVHEFRPDRLLGTMTFEINHQRASDGPGKNDPRNTRFLAAFKLDYKFRSWLVFDISYQYQQNLSNQDDGEFYQNRLILGMNFKF